MMAPLRADPLPWRLVLLVLVWHHAMAIHLFKLAKLFMLHVPLIVTFCHGSQQKALLSKRQKCVDV
jgi:hypothetical protein